MTPPVGNLTAGKVLTRSAIWNFAGLAFPVLIALILIPFLIKGMGKDRFGLLTIIWMGVGYFSLFDFGLGRTLTKLVSERLGENKESELGSLIWTAFILLIIFAFIGAFLLYGLSSIIVANILQVPKILYLEAIDAFKILAIGMPVVLVTTGLIGVLKPTKDLRQLRR